MDREGRTSMSGKSSKKSPGKPVTQGGVRQAARKPAKAKTKAKPVAVPAALLDELVTRATEVRERAYAPYSQYLVGAAIRAKSGRVYAGCNVENSTFGATTCAERNAVVQMVAAGDREIVACAVVTGDEGASPCGICRQVLAEFAGDDVPIVMVGLGAKGGAAGRAVALGELLPLAFRLATGAS
jgi:cytidine deaminase